MGTFTIEFFELCVLAEACIPPRPIARTMFWQSLTDQYWEQMTENERAKIFSWLQKNPYYEDSLAKEEDTQVFHARFDPTNQYEVTYQYQGTTESIRTFLYKDRYHTSTRRSVFPDYITRIQKLSIPHEH